MVLPIFLIAIICLSRFAAGYQTKLYWGLAGHALGSTNVKNAQFGSLAHNEATKDYLTASQLDNSPEFLSTSKSFFCYFLAAKNLTYNGYTNNLSRRLRQHNRELSGGALATGRAAGLWEYIAVLYSPSWTQQEAMRVEYRCKHPTGTTRRPARFSGPLGRIRSLPLVFEHFPQDSIYLFIHSRFEEELRKLSLPNNVIVRPLAELMLPTAIGS
eukprot:gene42053-51339_t